MNPENPRVTEARAILLAAKKMMKAVALVEVRKRLGATQAELNSLESDCDAKSGSLKTAIQNGKAKLKL